MIAEPPAFPHDSRLIPPSEAFSYFKLIFDSFLLQQDSAGSQSAHTAPQQASYPIGRNVSLRGRCPQLADPYSILIDGLHCLIDLGVHEWLVRKYDVSGH